MGKIERHGMCKSSEYKSWLKMKERCTNPNSINYHLYGGRGIQIHEPWKKSFIAFLEDVGMKPFPKAQLDRICTEGNYDPGNVRWVSNAVNSRNRRTTKLNKILVVKIKKMQSDGLQRCEIIKSFKEYSMYAIDHVLRGNSWVDVC